MTAPMFLAPRDRLLDDAVMLDGEEGRHAAVVRRIRPGERVDLTDGAGLLVECAVTQVDRDGLRCEVVSRAHVPAPAPRLTVVQALAKGDRGERAVEMMTEVGVDEIVPWAAERSVTRWQGDRGAKSLRKWRTTAREAAKQSRRAWLPEVADSVGLAALATRLTDAEVAIVLHEDADRPLGSIEVPGEGAITLVVGPEGGISDTELTRLTGAGAVAARMGPSVMRTSTAGAVAASVVLAQTPRWQ